MMNPYYFTNIQQKALESGSILVSFDALEFLEDQFENVIEIQKTEGEKKLIIQELKKADDKYKKIGTFSFVLEGKSIIPQGKLQDYFEIFHENKDPENLNPFLREKWIIASMADQIAGHMTSMI